MASIAGAEVSPTVYHVTEFITLPWLNFFLRELEGTAKPRYGVVSHRYNCSYFLRRAAVFRGPIQRDSGDSLILAVKCSEIPFNNVNSGWVGSERTSHHQLIPSSTCSRTCSCMFTTISCRCRKHRLRQSPKKSARKDKRKERERSTSNRVPRLRECVGGI